MSERLFVPARRHPLLGYAVAVMAVVLAALIRLGLNPVWGTQLPFFTFYPAIIAAGYVGGLGPGLLATALSTAAAGFFWLQPEGVFHVEALADVLAVVLFLGLGALISVLMESLHRATAARASTEEALARSAERLRILHQIDQAIIAAEAPQAIAEAAVRPLRELLGVPRAIVNLFDLAAGEVEWLAAAGRRRVRVGPGVRYSMRLMGDLDALKKGALQVIDVHALPPGPEVDALLASGVHEYMVVPMIAGGDLIGALSFGGAAGPFPPEQVSIAQEAATQLAIGIVQAQLSERLKREAEQLEERVRARTMELQAAQDNLVRAERLAVLGKVAGGVSHELRNPLGVITNAVYYLNIVAPDDTRIRKHLAILQREATRASRIVSGLLEFARVAPPRAATIDLNAAVRDLLDETTVPANITVSLRLAADLPGTVADADHVRLMISNIVGNAMHAMPTGGTLTIETGWRGSEVWVSIADTGHGIDPAHTSKIFDPLFTTRPTGTGLGLAVVKSLADRNAVRISVDSTPGLGTRFLLTFGFPGAAGGA